MILSLVGQSIFANNQPKPYDNMRYSAAFDQEAIYTKYSDLMKQMGCAHNVFSATKLGDMAAKSYDVVDQQHSDLSLIS